MSTSDRPGPRRRLLVERAGRRVLAMEVKRSLVVRGDDVRHLLWLRERLGPALLDAAVLTTGGAAYRRRDGIAVVPPSALPGPCGAGRLRCDYAGPHAAARSPLLTGATDSSAARSEAAAGFARAAAG